MPYSSKRLRTKDSYRLINVDSFENLDMFIHEVSKVKRLWINNFGVFATSENKPPYDAYIHFKCGIDADAQSSQSITFCGKELSSLTSTIERVLCLPDERQDRSIGFFGPVRDVYEDLILTPEQLQSILSVHESRSFSFWYLNLSPEQSVVLAAKTDLEGIWFCSISDKGLALIHWLEHHNEARTLGSFSCQYYFAWENIVDFAARSSYPVFDQLVFDQFYAFNNDPRRYDLLVNANVKSILVIINPHAFERGECEILLRALENGALVAPKLELDFDADSSELDMRLDLFKSALDALFEAMSTPECKLKELHLKMETVKLTNSAHVFERHLVGMLQGNQYLETLGINSNVEPLQFPALEILNAAAEHPHLRKIIFVIPPNCDPAKLESSSPVQTWLRNNSGHSIQFQGHTEKWQDYIFMSRFELLQQVRNERFRYYLLVMALAKHSSSPQRVNFLLTGNIDVFAK